LPAPPAGLPPSVHRTYYSAARLPGRGGSGDRTVRVGGAAAFAPAPGEGARPRVVALEALWASASGGGGAGAWARGRRLYWPADTPFGALVDGGGGGGGGGAAAPLLFDSAHAEERLPLRAALGAVRVAGLPGLPAPSRPDFRAAFWYDHVTDSLRPAGGVVRGIGRDER